MQRRGFKITSYLDDFWLIGYSHEECLAAQQALLNLLFPLSFREIGKGGEIYDPYPVFGIDSRFQKTISRIICRKALYVGVYGTRVIRQDSQTGMRADMAWKQRQSMFPVTHSGHVISDSVMQLT